MTELLDLYKQLQAHYGIFALIFLLVGGLLFFDNKFNDNNITKLIFKNWIVKLFKKEKKLDFVRMEHRINNFLIKLDMYQTIQDPERNKAKTIILTIKWTIFKTGLLEFQTIKSLEKIDKLEIKNIVLERFQTIIEHYEITLNKNLPKGLVDLFLSTQLQRKQEFFMIIENFMSEDKLTNTENLQSVFNYISATVLLNAMDLEKTFDGMNGNFEQFRTDISNFDIDKITYLKS